MVFKGENHDILPQTVYESKCQGQLADWLVSLTLEDEVRLRPTSSSLRVCGCFSREAI